jgi:hypothetical protein
MLEFPELLAVPSGYLLVEVSHDVAFDQYRDGCRLPWIGRYYGGQVPSRRRQGVACCPRWL